MDNFFNKHYIGIDSQKNIIAGFSDAFQQPEPTDILISAEGGHQFRLFPGGVENPILFHDMGIPIYKWNGTQAIERTPEDIKADMPPPAPIMPTDSDRIDALEAVMTGIISGDAPGEVEVIGFLATQFKLGRVSLDDVPKQYGAKLRRAMN